MNGRVSVRWIRAEHRSGTSYLRQNLSAGIDTALDAGLSSV